MSGDKQVNNNLFEIRGVLTIVGLVVGLAIGVTIVAGIAILINFLFPENNQNNEELPAIVRIVAIFSWVGFMVGIPIICGLVGAYLFDGRLSTVFGAMHRRTRMMSHVAPRLFAERFLAIVVGMHIWGLVGYLFFGGLVNEDAKWQVGAGAALMGVLAGAVGKWDSVFWGLVIGLPTVRSLTFLTSPAPSTVLWIAIIAALLGIHVGSERLKARIMNKSGTASGIQSNRKQSDELPGK